METALYFLGFTIGLALTWMAIKFKFDIKGMVSYFKSQTGLGALRGILTVFLVISLVILLSMCGQKAEAKDPNIRWLNWADVYFGLDYTNKQSPFCYENSIPKSGGIDDKTTSNLGFRLNVLEYTDRGYLNLKYTHHSCAFNRDWFQYDTVFAFEAGWKFWIR